MFIVARAEASIVKRRSRKHPKHASEGLQNSARHSSKPPEINVRSAPGRHNAPMKRHRDAQEGPRRARESPRSGQRGSRDVQERAKAGPEHANRAQDPSKTEPGELSDRFLARSLWEALFERPLERYCTVFLPTCNADDMWKILIFAAPATVL